MMVTKIVKSDKRKKYFVGILTIIYIFLDDLLVEWTNDYVDCNKDGFFSSFFPSIQTRLHKLVARKVNFLVCSYCINNHCMDIG